MVIDDKDAWQIAHAANIVIFTKDAHPVFAAKCNSGQSTSGYRATI